MSFGDRQQLASAIERFPVVKYLRNFGAEEQQKGQWATTCPKCGREKLIVSEKRKNWQCWYCIRIGLRPDGTRYAIEGGGGLLDLIQLLEGVDRGQAVARVLYGGTCSVEELSAIPPQEVVGGLLSDIASPRQIAPPPFWSNIFVDSSLAYLIGRGISLEDVTCFGLMHCTAGQYANRLIFPVWEQGVLVYWQARAMWDATPGDKMRNPPAGPWVPGKTEVLMNLDQARCYPRVAVVEGPIDCVHAGLDAVPTFGKTISPVQIAKLVRAGVRAVDLMWDAEAIAEMDAVIPLLATFFDVKKVVLPYGDPGDHPRGYLQECRRRAPSVGRQSRLALL